MKSKKRHSHRRYNGKRRNTRNRYKIAILLVIVFIIAVVIGSVFLGKYLKKKAEASEAERGGEQNVGTDTLVSPETENENIVLPIKPPEKITASYLKNEEIDSFAENAEEGSAVTLILRDLQGNIYYSSPVAQTLGGQLPENGLRAAEDIVDKLASKDCYISAYAALTAHSSEYETTAKALLAFEIAVLSELALSGVDEIVICGFDSIDADKVSMLCDFSKSFRKSSSSSVPLGVLLPYSFFLKEEANELCARISDCFELIAVDYTDAISSEEIGVSEVIAERIDSMQMYFSRYSVRVVLDSDDAEYESAAQAVSEAEIYSLQSVSRGDLIGTVADESQTTADETDIAE